MSEHLIQTRLNSRSSDYMFYRLINLKVCISLTRYEGLYKLWALYSDYQQKNKLDLSVDPQSIKNYS